MKKILLKYKSYSGSLQLTIFICLVIALLLSAFLLLNHTHRFFLQQSKSGIENILLCNSGVDFILTNDNLTSDTIAIQPLTDNNQKVEVSLSYWGIYQKGFIKATHREKTSYKIALIGSQIPSSNRSNLYLRDTGKPLKLVGKTVLNGNLYLPSQGVSPGYIAGQGFFGDNLVQGKAFKSNASLPILKNQYTKLIQNSHLTNNQITLQLLPENLSNSFLKPNVKIYSENTIELKNNYLAGNICIQSNEKITVSSKTKLNDVLLIAPIIEIEDNVKGNFQIIAEKKILIGKNCRLNYPSSIVLIPKATTVEVTDSTKPNLFIDSGSIIKGSIFYFTPKIKEYENTFKTDMVLNENTKLIGEIYCEGNLELKGTVIGSVYTDQFITNAFGTIFINHIFNGEITAINFPEVFCGALFDESPKNIVKWLY